MCKIKKESKKVAKAVDEMDNLIFQTIMEKKMVQKEEKKRKSAL